MLCFAHALSPLHSPIWLVVWLCCAKVLFPFRFLCLPAPAPPAHRFKMKNRSNSLFSLIHQHWQMHTHLFSSILSSFPFDSRAHWGQGAADCQRRDWCNWERDSGRDGMHTETIQQNIIVSLRRHKLIAWISSFFCHHFQYFDLLLSLPPFSHSRSVSLSPSHLLFPFFLFLSLFLSRFSLLIIQFTIGKSTIEFERTVCAQPAFTAPSSPNSARIERNEWGNQIKLQSRHRTNDVVLILRLLSVILSFVVELHLNPDDVMSRLIYIRFPGVALDFLPDFLWSCDVRCISTREENCA